MGLGEFVLLLIGLSVALYRLHAHDARLAELERRLTKPAKLERRATEPAKPERTLRELQDSDPFDFLLKREPHEVTGGEPKRRPRGLFQSFVEIGLTGAFITTRRKPIDVVRLLDGTHIILLERHEDTLVEGFREPMEKWTAYSPRRDRVQTYFLPRETPVHGSYVFWPRKLLLKRWVKKRVKRAPIVPPPS